MARRRQLTYSLDAWALLSFIEDEPSASRVEKLLAGRPVVSWINLGEVYCILRRRRGEHAADEAIRMLRPQLRLDDATPRRVLEAAALKAAYPVSYADAFAVATANAHEAVLVTGDPEIIDAQIAVRVESLRDAKE